MLSTCINVSSAPPAYLTATGVLLTGHSSIPASTLYRAIEAWLPRVGAALSQHHDLLLASATQYPVVFDASSRLPDPSDGCGWIALDPHNTVPVLYHSNLFAGLQSFQRIRALAAEQMAYSRINIDEIGAITLYICNVSIDAYLTP
jgi:hypothetical protein